MSPGLVKGFRLALMSALLLVTWLALTPSPLPLPGQSDKLGHLLAFLILAFLADFSFPRRGFDAAKYLPLLVYGLGIELLQSTLPHRYASLTDLLADALGLALYVLLIPLLRRIPLLFRQPLLRGCWDRSDNADAGK